MKIHIFNVPAIKIKEEEHPANLKENSLMITPHKKGLFGLGEQQHLISRIDIKNEQPITEVAVCKDLHYAREIAYLLVKKEDANFISH